MTTLSIQAWNAQGASEGAVVPNKRAANAWLRGWSDPEAMTVCVRDENEMIIGEKRTGRKTITWTA